MNRIDSLGSGSPIQKILNRPVQRQVPADAPKQIPAADKLELSGLSHLMKSLQSNDIRVDKVAAIRSQIEAGKYEDDHKLNVAVDRLLDEITA